MMGEERGGGRRQDETGTDIADELTRCLVLGETCDLRRVAQGDESLEFLTNNQRNSIIYKNSILLVMTIFIL